MQRLLVGRVLPRIARLLPLAMAMSLATGCGWWRRAPDDSVGSVSAANHACATLFCSEEGRAATDGQCAPSCQCGAYAFSEPEYDEYDLHALRSWQLINPSGVLPADPYVDSSMVPPETNGFCAAIPVDPSPQARTYQLETFRSEDEALSAGGQITHRGNCGACSSLQDLAVYIEQRNLARAGRQCGALGTFGSRTQLDCLEGLGFTEACAQIWSFNVDHTRSACLGICTATLAFDNNNSDGSLNACLSCDEELSGPIFKAVAGRTRRQSGLSSAIARPCLDERGEPAVYPVEHFYFAQSSGVSGP